MTKFTEFEIVTLWNHFKADFPSGLINKTHLAQMIKKTFPRHYRNISRISRTCFIVGVIIPRLSRQTCLGNWFVTYTDFCFEKMIKDCRVLLRIWITKIIFKEFSIKKGMGLSDFTSCYWPSLCPWEDQVAAVCYWHTEQSHQFYSILILAEEKLKWAFRLYGG